MRPYKHLTSRYIKDRIRLWAWSNRYPELPWLTRDAVIFLEQWLRPTDKGLEFGSGRSTLWFAARIGYLTSVESSRDWYDRVSERLVGHPAEVNYLLHQDGESNNADSDYVSVAKSFENASLDFVLVDGTARDHCALRSLDKIRPAGVLVLDNVERYIPRRCKTHSPNARGPESGYGSKTWELVGNAIESWRCIWTTDGVTDTGIWFKPCAKDS